MVPLAGARRATPTLSTAIDARRDHGGAGIRSRAGSPRSAPRNSIAASLLDVGLGALGVWLLSDDLQPFELAESPATGAHLPVRICLGVVLCAPVLALLASTIAHRRAEGGFEEPELRAGGRSIGLILLALVLGFSDPDEDAARDPMGFMHGGTFIAGLMSITGGFIMLGKRSRLRERREADRRPRRAAADQDP